MVHHCWLPFLRATAPLLALTVVVNDLDTAFKWSEAAWSRIYDHCNIDADALHDRTFSMSTAFSGMGAPEAFSVPLQGKPK